MIKLLYQADAVHNGIRPDLFKSNTPKYDEQELAAIIADEHKPIFVYDDGGVVGHAFCQIIEVKDHRLLQDMKTLYIDDMCVEASARRRHIGKALFEYAREYAVVKGFYNITLRVWECNPDARAFYEALGLKPQFTMMEWICK